MHRLAQTHAHKGERARSSLKRGTGKFGNTVFLAEEHGSLAR